MTAEQRSEWLQGLKPGDRVWMEDTSGSEMWPAMVVKVSGASIIVFGYYDECLGFFDTDGVRMANYINATEWRIEPLSEWRKEPPDEEGWWWCYRVLGPEPFLREMFAVYCSHDHDEWGYWTPTGYSKGIVGDCLWQKANVPAPPEEAMCL